MRATEREGDLSPASWWLGRPRSNGIARRPVSELQRARILYAMVEICGEHGFEAASVARIVARAGCSRRTFYDLFADRRDCLQAVLEDTVARALARAAPAYEAQGRWSDKVRAGLCALLEFFDEEPVLAELCFLLAPAGGPRVLARRAALIGELAAIVDGARPSRRRPPPLTAEALVGGAFEVIHGRLVRGTPGGLASLSAPLMAMLAYPYLGAAQARFELDRVPPSAGRIRRGQPARSSADPPSLRLTHRTLKALAAIASQPGSSNRDVAARAGVSDPGQISKLLARLSGLGLIRNTGAGQSRGQANAWSLTAVGQDLLRECGSQSAPAQGP